MDTNTTEPIERDVKSDDRRLLADVSKWAHANGWTDGEWRGFINARYSADSTIAVRPNECGFDVWHRDAGLHFTEYPATTVREAVDLLVALRILPDRFSSSFYAGVDSCRPVIRRLLHGLVFGGTEFVRLRDQDVPTVGIRSGDPQAGE